MKSIRTRMIVVFSLLIFLVTSILGLFITSIVNKNLIEDKHEDLINMSSIQAIYTESRKEIEFTYLDTIIRSPIIQDENTSLEEKIEYFTEEAKRSGYNYLAFSDLNGGAQVLNRGLKAENISNQEFFKIALEGKPNVSDVYIDESTGGAYIIYAIPLIVEGRQVGVFYGEKDGLILSEMAKEVRYGESGYAYIINREGTIVGHPNTDLVLAEFNMVNAGNENSAYMELSKLARDQILKNTSGSGTYLYEGENRMIGYSKIENSPWTLIMAIDEAEILQEVNTLKKLITAVILGMIILGGVLTFFLSGSIANPIVDMVEVIEKQGRLDFSFAKDLKAAKHLNRKDELGTMINAIKDTEETIRSFIEKTSDSVERVFDSSNDLQVTTEQSKIVEEQIAKTVEEIAKGASEQAKYTQDTVILTEEMGKSIDDNTDNILKIRERVEEIYSRKEDGSRALENLNEKMNENKVKVDKLGIAIMENNESAEKIERASDMIATIAEQTNLLALNAAIEAARAGLLGGILGIFFTSIYIVHTSYLSLPGGIFLGLIIVIATILPALISGIILGGIFKVLALKVFTGLLGIFLGWYIILRILGYPLIFSLIIYLGVVPFFAALFALLSRIKGENFSTLTTKEKTVTWILLMLLIVSGILVTTWYNMDGSNKHLVTKQVSSPSNRYILEKDNPSKEGSYKVSKLYYGSGTDKRRWEYGEGVQLETDSIDITYFLPDLSNFRLRLRQAYWGFDLSNSPINGRVWYPEGSGPFPLVLIVHGNHEMTKPSDAGYEYLGELLASRGYIFVSVDQNFLNGSFIAGDLTNPANVARGIMLLEHLKVWRDWNSQDSSPFYQKVDMDNIALIGHSRGGEAVAIAAALNKEERYSDNANITFDYGFNIKSLVAIAPVDESYTPAGRPIELEDISYLLIHGAHDGDVAVLMGNRQYQRSKFTGNDYKFKSLVYIYEANHSQFNTRWGRRDMRLPLGKLLNIKPIMNGEDQREIAKVYISAFLDMSIKGEDCYISLFKNYQAASKWLPETIILNRFQDSTFTLISDFEEDINPTTTSIKGGEQKGINLTEWREGPLFLREESMKQSNHVLFLGWKEEENREKDPSYKIFIPGQSLSDLKLKSEDSLTFSLADLSQGKHHFTDVTIELRAGEKSTSRVVLGDYAPIFPPLEIKFTKLGFIEGRLINPVEPILQTFEIPLEAFYGIEFEEDSLDFLEISFIFEHSNRGEIALDDIGFKRGNIKLLY